MHSKHDIVTSAEFGYRIKYHGTPFGNIDFVVI